MERTPNGFLDDAAQLVLDDLYWNTTTTMKVIAEQLGIPSKHVSRFALPVAAGIECWWCREGLTYASRTERAGRGPIPCRGCRATTPRFLIDLPLQPTDAIIILSTSGGRSPEELSEDVGDGVRALAMIGLRWAGRFETVDVGQGPAIVSGTISNALADIVVISSVRSLGVNQGDAFATFRRVLQQTRVRVITARDAIWASAHECGYRFSYDHSWRERVAVGSDFPNDHSDGGRSWADEYRMLAMDDGYWSTTPDFSGLRIVDPYY